MNYIMHYVMYYVVRCVPYSLVPALAILNAQEEAVIADVNESDSPTDAIIVMHVKLGCET